MCATKKPKNGKVQGVWDKAPDRSTQIDLQYKVMFAKRKLCAQNQQYPLICFNTIRLSNRQTGAGPKLILHSECALHVGCAVKEFKITN